MAHKVLGVDYVKIKMYDEVIRTLTEVRQVPSLKQNFI